MGVVVNVRVRWSGVSWEVGVDGVVELVLLMEWRRVGVTGSDEGRCRVLCEDEGCSQLLSGWRAVVLALSRGLGLSVMLSKGEEAKRLCSGAG